MAHNIDKGSNAQHVKAARMAYKMVKRQAVDEESSSAVGRQPLSTVTDDDGVLTLAPVRGGGASSTDSDSSVAAARSSTTSRRTTARASSTETDEDLLTSSTESSSSTRSTASSTTRSLAPVRASSSTTSSTPTTTSAGRTTSSPSSAATSSSTRGIADTTSSNDSNASTSGSSSNAGTIAGVIIAVIAVLLIAAFFGWRYWKKKKAARVGGLGAGENDTFYPFGGAGAAASSMNGDKGTGYNQRINSFEDLASNAAAANGYNGGEKYGNSNGYGTMGGGGDNDEKALGAAAGAAGFGAMNRQRSAEEENFAGRGLSPYNSFNSFSHLPPNGLQGLRSPQMNGTGYGSDSYPPTPQQQAHYSQQGSIFSNAPMAAGYAAGDHLPPHQDRALGNAMDAAYGSPVSNNGNAIALGAAGAAIGAAALAEQGQNGNGQQQGPFADPASEGKTYIVTRTFEPSMPDELLIYPGDKIQIVVPYDDGWCLGVNLSSAERESAAAGMAPRGVFPRDCVEEWTPELEKMMNGITAGDHGHGLALDTVQEEDAQRPTSVNSDVPLSQQADLQRAPTLPPLDIGDNSRFSMTSASANNNNKRISHLSNNNRPASLVPGQIPLPASIKSPVSATAVPLPEEGDEGMDAYGGVSDDVTSPVNKNFAPDIQVSSNDESSNAASNKQTNKRESVPQFGSSYHIADYASRLGDEEQQEPAANPEKRLSTLDEEESVTANDEQFPSTPRTTLSNGTSTSPRFSGFPPLSATGENNMPVGARSPASSTNARLSVAGSMLGNNINSSNRLSVASAMMPSSQSVKSLKRTSSLIAPQDAETFLASPTSGEPNARIA